MVPPHGKANLTKSFIIKYLKQLIFQKAVPKAVHRQTKTLYEYSTLRSEIVKPMAALYISTEGYIG
jgi:hypothetical protein